MAPNREGMLPYILARDAGHVSFLTLNMLVQLSISGPTFTSHL